VAHRQTEPLDWRAPVALLGIVVAPATFPLLPVIQAKRLRGWRLAIVTLSLGVVGIVAHWVMLGGDAMIARQFGWQAGFVDAFVRTLARDHDDLLRRVAPLTGYLSDWGAWKAALAAQWPVGVTLAGLLAIGDLLADPPDTEVDRRWRVFDYIRTDWVGRASRRPVIGAVVEAGNAAWESGRRVIVPAGAWYESITTTGATGSGKTTTLLALARAARSDGLKVMWLDLSGDPKLPARFVATMLDTGVDPERIRVWPSEPYDAWRTVNVADLADRLVGLLKHNEQWAYFEDLARAMTLAAVEPGDGSPPPASAAEFVARLHYDTLTRSPHGRTLRDLRKDQVQSVGMRYRQFFEAVAGSSEAPMVGVPTGQQHRHDYVQGVAPGALDGTWSFDDCDAAVLAVNALGNHAHAASAGRLFLRELSYHASTTKPEGDRWLIVVDEFSALHDPQAIELVERIRKFGCGVVIGTHSVESREFDWGRLLAAGGAAIIHRTAKPEQLVALAGTQRTERRVYNFRDDDLTGSGQAAVGHEYIVDPNAVRRLPTGEGVIVSDGRAVRVRFDGSQPVGRYAEAQRLLTSRLRAGSPPTVEVVEVEQIPHKQASDA
jgi:hypothetical protein